MTGDADHGGGHEEAQDGSAEVPDLSTKRWPFDALCWVFGTDEVAVIAERCGVSVRAVRRAATEGLTDEQADEWAIYAGLHPALIWGWEWVSAGQDAAEATPDAGTGEEKR